MITYYPREKHGYANYGWLDTRHHFSFADYYNPQRMGFRTLRVVNDDIIKPQTGFPLHPHRNMEIITYVRQGAISHKDSEGNVGVTNAGDVQVMSAGRGIRHSEYNYELVDTKIFQIWIEPKSLNTLPQWQAHQYPQALLDDFVLLVSGDGDAPLKINQDAKIYAGNFNAQKTVSQRIPKPTYMVIAEGELELDHIVAREGDAFELYEEPALVFKTLTKAKVLLIEV